MNVVVRFIDRPGVEELRKQHAVMAGVLNGVLEVTPSLCYPRHCWAKSDIGEVKCLRQIVHHDGNLDLCLRFWTQRLDVLASGAVGTRVGVGPGCANHF